MSAYPPPLFQFPTLKFNSLIYEVTETVSAVASSIVNVLSIITNKIFTYDTGLSRELWTDSDLMPIIIGSPTTDTQLGGFLTSGANLAFYNTAETVYLFQGSNEVYIANISPYIFLGHGQVAGDLLYVGNQLNTNYIGGFQLIDQTLTALVDTNPVHLFDTNTASITLGQGVDIGNSVTIGNSDCNVACGGFQMSFGNLTYYTSLSPVFLFNDSNVIYFGQNCKELYIGQGQTSSDYVFLGNQTNINTVAGFLIINQSIEALVNADPVSLVDSSTGNITLGTGQGVGNNIIIGSSTNTNRVSNFNFVGNDITSSSPTTNVSFMSNLTSAGLSIGSGQNALGTVNIGSVLSTILCGPNFRFQGPALTSGSLTTNITMFNELTTGSVQLAVNQTAGGSVSIGNFGNTNRMGNFTYLGNVITSSGSNTLNLYNNQTHANGCNFLAGFTGATINFLAGLSSGPLNIAVNQSATGNVNIGSSVSTILLGPNFRFQGSALTSSAVTSAISLFGNITTGSVTILNAMTTAFCNIGGTAVTTGGLRLYNAITMGYTTLITPTVNQVGYIQQGTGTLNTVTGVTTTLRTLVLGVGVWILTGRLWSNGSANYVSLFISNSGNSVSNTHASILTGTASGNNAGSINKYLTVTTGTTTQYFNADASGTFALQGVSFEAIRIA